MIKTTSSTELTREDRRGVCEGRNRLISCKRQFIMGANYYFACTCVLPSRHMDMCAYSHHCLMGLGDVFSNVNTYRLQPLLNYSPGVLKQRPGENDSSIKPTCRPQPLPLISSADDCFFPSPPYSPHFLRRIGLWYFGCEKETIGRQGHEYSK